jgi:hypothetical protein
MIRRTTGPSLSTSASSCRVCGCTEDDCTSCIRQPGTACSWVTDDDDPDAMTGDLCSACTPAARRARYEAAAPALGLVGKDALSEEEYLLLEAGQRNTAGIIARPFQVKPAVGKKLTRLGLAKCDHVGKGMTITEKGLQAIGRGDAPSAVKAPVQEQTPGIHVSGPMPPETFKLKPEDLEGSVSNAATVGSGRIRKVLHLYETVPFACVHVGNGVNTPKGSSTTTSCTRSSPALPGRAPSATRLAPTADS